MPLRIGVDIGGTFTDLVLVDDATGAVRIDKLLTTAKDPAEGSRSAWSACSPMPGRAPRRSGA